MSLAVRRVAKAPRTIHPPRAHRARAPSRSRPKQVSEVSHQCEVVDSLRKAIEQKNVRIALPHTPRPRPRLLLHPLGACADPRTRSPLRGAASTPDILRASWHGQDVDDSGGGEGALRRRVQESCHGAQRLRRARHRHRSQQGQVFRAGGRLDGHGAERAAAVQADRARRGGLDDDRRAVRASSHDGDVLKGDALLHHLQLHLAPHPAHRVALRQVPLQAAASRGDGRPAAGTRARARPRRTPSPCPRTRFRTQVSARRGETPRRPIPGRPPAPATAPPQPHALPPSRGSLSPRRRGSTVRTRRWRS